MKVLARIATATAVALALGVSAASATEITFYYPIAVGGPITKIFDGYAEAFHKAHPDITVKPVYTGSYQDSIVKAMTAAKSGNAPDAAVLLSTDMFTLIDNELIEPVDTIATKENLALTSATRGPVPAHSPRLRITERIHLDPKDANTLVD